MYLKTVEDNYLVCSDCHDSRVLRHWTSCHPMICSSYANLHDCLPASDSKLILCIKLSWVCNYTLIFLNVTESFFDPCLLSSVGNLITIRGKLIRLPTLSRSRDLDRACALSFTRVRVRRLRPQCRARSSPLNLSKGSHWLESKLRIIIIGWHPAANFQNLQGFCIYM